jgi:methenyltetrahydrofolate cyclohydrolase
VSETKTEVGGRGSGADSEASPDASLQDTTGNFAVLVAAGTPAPGGGSVAAYAGVLASALGQMMCNLTVGKKKYEQVEQRVKEIRGELERHAARLSELIAEDAASFDAVMQAFRLPKETEQEKAERAREIERAGQVAVSTPYETARRALEVLRLLAELRKIGNPNAIPDLTMGSQLAQTAIKGAYYNIGVNLSLLSKNDASEMRQKIESLMGESTGLAGEIEADMIKAVTSDK